MHNLKIILVNFQSTEPQSNKRMQTHVNFQWHTQQVQRLLFLSALVCRFDGMKITSKSFLIVQIKTFANKKQMWGNIVVQDIIFDEYWLLFS